MWGRAPLLLKFTAQPGVNNARRPSLVAALADRLDSLAAERHRRGVRGDCPNAPARQVGYENAVGAKGQRLIWLDRAVVNRLRSLHGVG